MKDQQGIIKRYLREMGGWDAHLYNTRHYILDSVKRLEPEIVTILGSGWLLDIPLEEIADTGARINLVDISHPPQVKRRASKFGAVTLLEDDITGGLIESVFNIGKERPGSLSELDIPEYRPAFEPGLIVSANLLTQLDMLPVEYMVNNFNFGNDEYREFRRKIEQAHINLLRSHSSLLISDSSEVITRDGEVLETNNLLFTPFPEGDNNKEWEWEFDTNGLYYTGKKVLFRVRATEPFKI